MKKKEEVISITASEILRRHNGPWTEEEIAYRDAKGKELHDIIFAPLLKPIVERVFATMVKAGIIKETP